MVAKKEANRFANGNWGNAAHVKLALEYDIDVLWCKNNSKSFAVQEIADALAEQIKLFW
jgi:chorismate mutase